jgi:CRP/FNR family transcriptional regulator, anaerobic regulatory protein
VESRVGVVFAFAHTIVCVAGVSAMSDQVARRSPHARAVAPPAMVLPPELMEPVRRASAFHSDAVERTAALLIVLSRNNGYEGRDPNVIADDLHCGLVADMLGIGIDTLAGVLVDLERRELIEWTKDGGLRLRDIPALDLLSEGRPGAAPALRVLAAADA